MSNNKELAIVGAGILGLAHAYWAAKSGIKTVVFERNSQAQGASVRNFGMLISEFQATGIQKRQAEFAEDVWHILAHEARLTVNRCGALLIAMSALEKKVLMSFAATVSSNKALWVEPQEFGQYSQLARTDLAMGALWMPQVVKVDQRSACVQLSRWLQKTKGVEFVFDATVESINLPQLSTSAGDWQADRVIVCGGDEYNQLYPDAFAASKVGRCQLQMLRTVPQPGHIQNEPFILGGLSYSRYGAFKSCEGFDQLQQELEQRYPEQIKHGVHVIAAQELDGSITVGDSHQYGIDITDDRLQEVDELILDYLQKLLTLPKPEIQSRWLGHYSFLPGQQQLHINAADKIDLITITSGQGMTLSFAVANELMAELGMLRGSNNEKTR